jgi:hypothetical protein
MLKALKLADLHSGSIYSPAVPKARTDYSGGTIGLNPLQSKILLPKWRQMCQEGPYDFVVVNGDLVDGLNAKSKGAGLWTYQLDLQAENAARLLDMIVVQPNAPIYIIGGTGYHVGENPGIDQLVAEKLGALGKNAKYCGLERIIQIGKQKFHYSHWASDALYDGTALSKEVDLSVKNEIDVTGMFRAHRHHYGIYSNGFRFCCMLPAWKGRDDYVQVKGMRYAKTEIGWATMLVDEHTWDVKPTLWKLENTMPTIKIAGKTETFKE